MFAIGARTLADLRLTRRLRRRGEALVDPPSSGEVEGA